MNLFIYLKKILHKLLLMMVVLQCIATTVLCQDNLNTITAAFNQYQQHASQEKLFVHTDKNFYLAGEIVWFKVYAVDVTFNKPIDISKVAYAEILDTANKPVMQAKIAMNSGNGNGSIYLPLTLNSGNYKLRAYTNWMKNGGPDCFFEKIISIVNVQRIYAQPAQSTTAAYDVQFFPEGGNLVAGLESKVAFKITDNNGSGIDASGAITDNGNTVVQFATSHAGMGSFEFTPQANHTYKAIVQASDGKIINKVLPAAYSSGMVMRVATDGNNIKVQVQSAGAGSEAVYLLAHAGAAVKVAQQSMLQNGTANFSFSRSLLGDGVSHITLFNALHVPVCERLYFKKPDAFLNITAGASQNEYAARSKVTINVAAGLQQHDAATLSMAVYRLDSLQTVDENTIETYLLLASELRGNIEDVPHYFKDQNEQTAQDLDNLVLVNGWRRFKWEAVLNNSQPLFTYIPEYNGHIVTGKVTNASNGLPQRDVETYLSAPGLRTQFATATSDSNGIVRFEMKDCFGASALIAQTHAQNEAYKIQLDNPFSEAYSATAIPAFHLPEKNPNTLLDQSISMQVQNIYASGKLNAFDLPAVDTAAFYVHPDSKYNLDDYTRFSTMEEVLREYVAMVNLTKRNGMYHMQVFDKGHDDVFKDDPLVLLDGVPVLNFNKFLAVDPLKVKSLDVVQRKYYYGATSFDGILNWKTYNGDMANYELDPTEIAIDYEGLQLEREFYSPVYAEDKLSHMPDFRNVLYWNPNITLTSGKEQSLNFYTSDMPGKYAIVVQGISSNGLCGSTINTFEVKE